MNVPGVKGSKPGPDVTRVGFQVTNLRSLKHNELINNVHIKCRQ